MSKFFKLLKFVIKTRVSNTMLAILLIVILYSVFTGLEIMKSGIKIETKIPEYYAVAYATFFMVFSSFSGGLAVLKSDRDYLFMLPIKKSQLIISLFIAQIVILGTAIIAFVGFYLPFLELNVWDIIISFVLFILFITSLSTYVGDLQTTRKAIIAVLLALWGISPYFGFKFSPTGIFFGYPLYGILVLFPATIISMIFTVRKLASVSLEYQRSLSREGNAEFKDLLRFSKYSGIKALYYLNIMYITVSGRSGGMGYGIKYFSNRIKLRTLLVYLSVLSAVYYIAVWKIFLPYAQTASIIITIFSISFFYSFTQSSISNERPWLSFTSIDPGEYLSHLSLSKTIATFIITLPLIIANALLYFVGGKAALSQVPTLAIAFPSILIISFYIVSRFNIIPQIKEEGVMPGQMRGRQMFFAIPIYVVIIVSLISSFNIVWGSIISMILFIIAIACFLNKKIWREAAFSLVENGYT